MVHRWYQMRIIHNKQIHWKTNNKGFTNEQSKIFYRPKKDTLDGWDLPRQWLIALGKWEPENTTEKLSFVWTGQRYHLRIPPAKSSKSHNVKWNHPRYLSSVDDPRWESSITNKLQKNKQEWIHQRMVQNPLSSNDTVHWTVQIFQNDDWRRKEKRNLRHDRKIKSSVWTRHHHPRVQIPVVCEKKKTT
jgi:hypothetical protein